jgi:hypothetical protein
VKVICLVSVECSRGNWGRGYTGTGLSTIQNKCLTLILRSSVKVTNPGPWVALGGGGPGDRYMLKTATTAPTPSWKEPLGGHLATRASGVYGRSGGIVGQLRM